MAELLRPEPRLSRRDRAASLLSGVSLARMATAAGAVLLLAVTAWWLLRAPAPPVERSLPLARPATTSSVASAAGGPIALATTVAELVVQAAGAVANPGVYHVPSGARVVDVVSAAGGPTPGADLQAVPLASKVVDGQRVYVPVAGEVAPPVGAGPGAADAGRAVTPTPAAPLDLNQATVDQLDTLPGVGPATAQAIVDYRTRQGPFASVDDLLAVRGIGAAKLDAFRDLVRAG